MRHVFFGRIAFAAAFFAVAVAVPAQEKKGAQNFRR